MLQIYYDGLPPTRATVATIMGLLVSFATYAAALMVLCRLLTGPTSVNAPAPPPELPGRRALLVGGIGVVAVVATGGMLRLQV